MIPYQQEKIDNAISFIAKEHIQKTRRPLYQTSLYKYLAFLDFKSLEETGQPVLGLTYIAMQRGPVPKEIYEKRDHLQSPLFELRKLCGGQIIVRPKRRSPDLNYFSRYEISLMKKLVEIFADRFIDTKIMSDASHEEIKAWRDTYANKPNSIIDYASTYSNNLFSKSEEELTYPEEIYLTYRAFGGK